MAQLGLQSYFVRFTFTGELGGSTLNDDVGKDINSKHRDGLPKSPSSSGGFCQFSSKGLYREDMSAQHYFAGNMDNGTICTRHIMFFAPRINSEIVGLP